MKKTLQQKITDALSHHTGAITVLKTLDRGITSVFYALYPMLVLYVFLQKHPLRWRMLLIPGISFVLVSAFRHIVNRSRPYENGIIPLWQKDREGHSFPSRHVFSASMIAMSILQVNSTAGFMLLVLAGVEGAIRVLAGVHYCSDVAAGWIIGVVCGFMYWL